MANRTAQQQYGDHVVVGDRPLCRRAERRTSIDPLPYDIFFRIGKRLFSLWGHKAFVNHFIEQALFGIARLKNRSGFTTANDTLNRAQIKFGLLLVRSVAADTSVVEDGLDVLSEKRNLLGVVFSHTTLGGRFSGPS